MIQALICVRTKGYRELPALTTNRAHRAQPGTHELNAIAASKRGLRHKQVYRELISSCEAPALGTGGKQPAQVWSALVLMAAPTVNSSGNVLYLSGRASVIVDRAATATAARATLRRSNFEGIANIRVAVELETTERATQRLGLKVPQRRSQDKYVGCCVVELSAVCRRIPFDSCILR